MLLVPILCSVQVEANITKDCIFPFTYDGVTYIACTTVDDDKPSCSLLVDDDGKHVGGKSNRGYCGQDCPVDPHDGKHIMISCKAFKMSLLIY